MNLPSRFPLVRLLLAIAAVAVAALGLTAQAQASKSQQSMLQDDRVLTFQPGIFQNRSLDLMQQLGVDVVHSVVVWRRLSPASTSSKRPRGFDPSNPASYSPFDWDPYDALVRGAAMRGMQVQMTLSSPIPDWASHCPRKANKKHNCRPDVSLYKAFVTAVARRYSGSYRDENQLLEPLPAVRFWSFVNEPNLAGWLSPQKGGRHNSTRIAASLYRNLAYAGIDALHATGHARDTILIGDTAPLGGTALSNTPVDFYRDLFCMDSRGHKLRGSAARTQGCAHARRLDASGIAHHPYVRGAGPPLPSVRRNGAISIGQLSRLEQLIKQGGKVGMIPKGVGVWFDEFGVSSRPPDRKYGVPSAKQAAFLNQVDYLSYRDRYVRSVAQFELQDNPSSKSNRFQTGLVYGNGKPKPALRAYRIPIYVTPAGGKLRVWGQVRPAADGAAETVQVENRTSKKASFQTVTTVPVNVKGFVDVRVAKRPGAWRLLWIPSRGGLPLSSRIANVDRSNKAPQPGPSPGGPDTFVTLPPPFPNGQGAQYWDLELDFVRTALVPTAAATGHFGSGHVVMNPSGRDCNATCSQTFQDFTPVTLTASPDSGSTFKGWGGACAVAGTGACTVNMTQARKVTANFEYLLPA